MSVSREDEDAVRSVLREQVADVYASADLAARVEAGTSHRRKLIRRTVVSASAVVAAGCAATVVFAFDGGRSVQHTPAARPPLTCPALALSPGGVVVAPVQSKPAIPGAAHSLVPGSPIAAVSCAATGAHRTTELTPGELASTVAALKSVRLDTPLPGGMISYAELDHTYEPVSLIFAYSNGMRLTVVADAESWAGTGPVYWTVSNGPANGEAPFSALGALAVRSASQ